MTGGLLNYSLFTSNMTIDYDTSYVKDLEIENVQSNGDSCTVKAKVSLGGKYMDRVLYCNLECQKYDVSGWEVGQTGRSCRSISIQRAAYCHRVRRMRA